MISNRYCLLGQSLMAPLITQRSEVSLQQAGGHPSRFLVTEASAVLHGPRGKHRGDILAFC